MLPELISQAKRYLAESPFDSLHASSHHQKVWENSLWIASEEGLEVDLDALQVAAWWHDIERGSDDFNLLRQALESVGATPEFKEKVFTIIINHSFGQNQESLEAKVLYDADKLEYLSVERVENLLRDFKNGEMNQERVEYYKREWAGRIKLVRKSLHFHSSKKRFDDELVKFVEFCQSNPALAEFISGVL